MDTQDMDTEFADLSEIVAEDGEKDTAGVYELGYHLVPTLGEGDVSAGAAVITELLKKTGANIIGERAPLSMRLAYPMEKKIDGAKQSFEQAYFGWVAFELHGTLLKEVDDALKAHAHILRHLIVKTERDAVAATLADPTLDVPAIEVVGEEEETKQEAPEDGTVESVGADTKDAEH